ncbi:histidine phosphatase family protein [Croceicoccus sp. F390]|uniref:Histidine phosphatase family protein n=1 Tax=Croceicoccus esteveae TaxID=3075597 RepID=A0ABU2ZEM0_9SPHN|nr:histidine phosphatase family protein [Croceicoccus sp. F390]MDT0575051.1 histidine phosphatase family protein [Croceicoccus sp. F390]
MKTIGLLRHAKSEEHVPAGRDFDRGLNAKGERAALAIGRHIHAHGPVFERIIASPAARVRATLDIVRQAIGDAAPQVIEDRQLYLATAETIAEVAAEHGGGVDKMLIVAHEPGLADFVLSHVPHENGNSLRETVAEKYPTGAFAVLNFDIEDWSQLAAAQGRLCTVTRPRDLDVSLGPEFADQA